ncbi:MAG: Gfo/Idh/MocA family oxidoreductase [bacterium]
MRIAIIGTGFVADYYIKTLPLHPELELLGVFDRNEARKAQFAAHHKITGQYPSLEALLADDRLQLVLNLTDPRSHYEVSRLCLQAGKHVYSEKPIAMEIAQAKELIELAETKNLLIVSAPCSVLGEAAQTFWKALREGFIGKPRLVYAEMDEGMVFKMPFREWSSEAGAPWPYKDEFEIGTTLEHAGYVLTWLPAFFGPAASVFGFATNLFPDKVPGEELDMLSPDFGVAVIRFHSGVIARLTNSLIAPHNHSLKVYGDEGALTCDDTWFYGAPVYTRKSVKIRRKSVQLPWKVHYPAVKKAPKFDYRGVQQMDFARGPAELADSIRENRPCRLSPRYCLHVNELVLAVNNAGENGMAYQMTTTFDPPEPMPWAR